MGVNGNDEPLVKILLCMLQFLHAEIGEAQPLVGGFEPER